MLAFLPLVQPSVDQPAWDAPLVGAAELYDHTGDDGADFDAASPRVNLGAGAAARAHAAVMASLSGALRRHFQHDGWRAPQA